jgi:hypothetical protein
MSVLRALFVAILAASIATPPLAAAEAHGGVARAAAHAEHSEHAAAPDCCPPGQHCHKANSDDCARDVVCALKCLSLSAVVLPTWDAAIPRSTSRTANLLSEDAAYRVIHPPLPPPRI